MYRVFINSRRTYISFNNTSLHAWIVYTSVPYLEKISNIWITAASTLPQNIFYHAYIWPYQLTTARTVTSRCSENHNISRKKKQYSMNNLYILVVRTHLDLAILLNMDMIWFTGTKQWLQPSIALLGAKRPLHITLFVRPSVRLFYSLRPLEHSTLSRL